MNKQEWDYIVDRVLGFNRLITTPEERNTEAYYIKCCNLLDEEKDEGLLGYVNRANYFRNREGWSCTVELLDAFCDIIVTGVQCLDAIFPSQLERSYISQYLDTPTKECKGSVHSFLRPVVQAIVEAELEGADIVRAMKEVCDSNDTKIPTLDTIIQQYGNNGDIYKSSVDEAIQAGADWIMSQEGYDYEGCGEVTGKVIIDTHGVDRVIYRDQNLKLRKPFTFKEPELGEYV